MLRYVANEARNAVSDRVLVDRLHDGDSDALDILFRRHARTVFAYAYARLRRRADAEEIVQDAFVILWERRRDVTLAGESLLPWLLTTARFRVSNLLRTWQRARIAPLTDVEDVAIHADRTAEAVELTLTVELLDRAVASLSDLDRRIFLLCVEGDSSYAEAAKELGISHAALRGRLSRLRGRLRDELDLLRGR